MGLVTIILIAVGVIAFILILLTGYVKASPDEAIIISGLKPKPKFITGTATIKIPFFERKDRLSLRVIKIDVKTREAVPTKEVINVNVDSVVMAKISSKPELLNIAAQNFLNQNEDYIAGMVSESLEGNIREIIGGMNLIDMITDRQEFANKVQQNAVPDMERMGIEIVSFNVQNFSDKNGVIDDLGIDNVTKIKKNAAIVKAESERDMKIAQAHADKEANEAQVNAAQEIAIKQNQLNIKKADLQKVEDTKRAEADAAYAIQKEEQRKTIEISTANANIARQEKEIELRMKEVEIAEKVLEAEVKKKADAERYAAQQKADADLYEKQRAADAKKYEVQQEAEALKARSAAEKFAKEQEAEGIRAKSLAEADGIRAKGLAEAEGIEKKAEAMKKMDEAAILEMYFNVLPEISANIAKPLENIDKITMYGEGNAAKLIEDITKSTTQITEGLTAGLGIDVKSMLAGFLGGKVATQAAPLNVPNTEVLDEVASSLDSPVELETED